MLGMELLDCLRGVSDVEVRFPGIFSGKAFPFDEILELAAVYARVKYLFDLVFLFTVDDDWFRRGRRIEAVIAPGR